MPSRLERIIELMHCCGDASLATLSQAVSGFPYASALAFAPDPQHRAILLMSRLAEHTQNLGVDSRASLLVREPVSGADVARLTMVGHVVPLAAQPLLLARYLRYQPEAEQFAQLGDFHFFCLEPQKIRVIGGFAQAGWLEGERLRDVPSLSLEDEAEMLATLAARCPADLRLLGIDAYGFDYVRQEQRRRASFSSGPVLAATLDATMTRTLARLK